LQLVRSPVQTPNDFQIKLFNVRNPWASRFFLEPASVSSFPQPTDDCQPIHSRRQLKTARKIDVCHAYGHVFSAGAVLGEVTNRLLGTPGPKNLSASQIAFYRAGHAHAGVLTLLALFLQIAVDHAALPPSFIWPVRVGAIAAAILVAGGFFGLAHSRSLRVLLYTGAVLVTLTTLTVGIGLIRSS
jgi:hypothetical protein